MNNMSFARTMPSRYSISPKELRPATLMTGIEIDGFHGYFLALRNLSNWLNFSSIDPFWTHKELLIDLVNSSGRGGRSLSSRGFRFNISSSDSIYPFISSQHLVS